MQSNSTAKLPAMRRAPANVPTQFPVQSRSVNALSAQFRQNVHVNSVSVQSGTSNLPRNMARIGDSTRKKKKRAKIRIKYTGGKEEESTYIVSSAWTFFVVEDIPTVKVHRSKYIFTAIQLLEKSLSQGKKLEDISPKIMKYRLMHREKLLQAGTEDVNHAVMMWILECRSRVCSGKVSEGDAFIKGSDFKGLRTPTNRALVDTASPIQSWSLLMLRNAIVHLASRWNDISMENFLSGEVSRYIEQLENRASMFVSYTYERDVMDLELWSTSISPCGSILENTLTVNEDYLFTTDLYFYEFRRDLELFSQYGLSSEKFRATAEEEKAFVDWMLQKAKTITGDAVSNKFAELSIANSLLPGEKEIFARKEKAAGEPSGDVVVPHFRPWDYQQIEHFAEMSMDKIAGATTGLMRDIATIRVVDFHFQQECGMSVEKFVRYPTDSWKMWPNNLAHLSDQEFPLMIHLIGRHFGVRYRDKTYICENGITSAFVCWLKIMRSHMGSRLPNGVSILPLVNTVIIHRDAVTHNNDFDEGEDDLILLT